MLLIPCFFIFLGLLVFILPYFLTNSIKIQNVDVELQFNGENAYEFVEDQLNIGFRIPGTQERANCANYFLLKFREIDYNFTYIFHNFTVHSTECQNVLFKLNQNYDNIIILAAHYDTRAKATKDPLQTNRDLPIPGANDGASGSAVLIELAKVLYKQKANLSCQIWFLFFDAEDQGKDLASGIVGWDWCEGSKKFVEEINKFYDSKTEFFDCMILLDMVGGSNLKFIKEKYSTSSLLNELFTVGRKLGYTSEFPLKSISASITDDHTAFIKYGIPAADLIINFWNNPNWPYHHTTDDNLNHISNYSLEVTGKTVEQFVYNNYKIGQSEEYKGYYPWHNDLDLPDLEVIIFVFIIGSFLGILYLISQQKTENVN